MGGEHSHGMGSAYNGLAWCLNEQGKHAETADAANKAVVILDTIDPTHNDTLTALGRHIGALCMQNKYPECNELCTKGVQRMAEVRHPGPGAQVLVGEMAYAYRKMGNTEQSEAIAYAMHRLASCLAMQPPRIVEAKETMMK